MAAVTDSELKAAIKMSKLDNLYYFYGKDTASVERFKKAVVSKAVKKGDEAYNLHTFDGKKFDTDEFTDACEALPVFADHVCCTVEDLNAETLDADTLKWLVKFISDIPDTTVLIFYYTSVDVTDGKKEPQKKNKKLADAVAKKGTVCNFAYKTPDVLSKSIMAKLQKSGTAISKADAFYLAQLCLCDTMTIENETDKLIAYMGGAGEVTRQTIDFVCVRQLDTSVYDLTKAIARGDRSAALGKLSELEAERTEPMQILYAVSSNMIDLYRAKLALGSGKSPYEAAADFGYPPNLKFRIDNAFRDARVFSLGHLRKCMQIITETDVLMKSVRTDKMTLLEEAIIKMLSSR